MTSSYLEDEHRLPEDIAAEASLLATLCGPGMEDQAREILPRIQAADFAHPAHRCLFRALDDVLEDDGEVSKVTLQDALSRAGNLGKVGGSVGLTDLLCAEEVGRPHVLLEILIRKRKQRELVKAGSDMVRAALADDADPAAVLDTAKALAWNWQGEAGGDPLKLIDPAAWTASEPPPPRYLLDGLLPAGAPAILAGKPNCGKSMLALQVSFAVATGRGLFGRKGPDAPMGILYVQLEDAPEEIHRRFRRCLDLAREDREWTKETEATLLRNWRAVVPDWEAPGAKTLPALLPWLVGKASELPTLGLIVLDTFAALSEGEENSAESHRPFWSAAFSLASQTGATPLVLHHTRKVSGGATGGRGPASMSDRLSFESLRGSTAITAGARAILQVEPLSPEEAEKADLDELRAAAGNYVALALTKNNSGPKGTWLGLEQREAGENGAGFFTPMPKGDSILAHLRSKGALASLGKAEEVLLDVASGLDHQALAAKHYPGDSKGRDRIKHQLRDLRHRHQWLQPRSLALTVTGFERVKELKGRQADESAYPQEVENELWPESA